MPADKGKRSPLEKASFAIAGLVCIIGLISVYISLVSTRHIDHENLYWFLLVLAAIFFPYIKEITIKDIKLALKDITETKKSDSKHLENAVNSINNARKELEHARISLQEVKDRIDPTRIELIKGYQIYLSSLCEADRMKKIQLLSRLYLKSMNLTISQVKKMLTEIGYYHGKLDSEFTNDYYEALNDFQKDTNLNPDGIFGFMTYRNILEKQLERNGSLNEDTPQTEEGPYA